MKLDELLSQWDSNEGKPYKGSLIDWAAQEESQQPCTMCAQGQVLHLIGGMEPRSIRYTEQRDADRLTADLLKISRAHAVLLRSVNDRVDGAPSIVLTDPGKVLGGQWSKLLDFWWHLDRMTPADWWKYIAAWAAARDAAGASNEIQGAALMRERGKPFFFLPLFGFADPEAIPARPTAYGRAA